jgi:hypothetical protein
MGTEVVIPDLAAPELGTVFALKTAVLTREHDLKRYRSMVAVPITTSAGASIWGVAVVTTDRANHFTNDPSDGVSHTEPARAIAAMAGLAVKAIGGREPAAAPASLTVDGTGAAPHARQQDAKESAKSRN